MGAAALGELTPAAPGAEPAGETALANARIDAERRAEGMSPIMNSARMQNPEAWDEATRRLTAEPGLARRLVEEVTSKARPLDVVEQAVLLREKIRLDNDARSLGRQLREEQAPGGTLDSIDAATLEGRADDVDRQRYELALAVRRTGTELGRSLQFRRQLAAEDYSLRGMLQDAARAKGKPLSDEEVARITEMQGKIAELQDKLDEALKGGKFGEVKDAKVASGRAEGDYQEQLNEFRSAKQSWPKRFLDTLIKLRVNEVISSPRTIARIVGAAAYQIGITPVREATGLLWANVPGLAKIAALAPREGAPSLAAERLSLLGGVHRGIDMGGLWQGLKDAYETARTGKSELDVLHKPPGEPRGWLDLQFSLHDAVKAPAVRAEYTRSFVKRLDAAAARGEDVSHPENLLKISAEAYVDSQAAKFRQQHWLIDTMNKALTPGPKAGAGEIAAKGVGRLLMPVVRIPTNVALETGEYLFGTGAGSARALAAYSRGLDKLQPAQADAIMRNFKKGSLGMGLALLGYFQPQLFGGFYQEDEKKNPGEAPFGGGKVGDVTIPSALMHHPLLNAGQFGATVRKAQDSLLKSNEPRGPVEGVFAGLAGVGEEFPLTRAAKENVKAFSSRERGRFLGTLLKSLAVPQVVQWLAGKMDLDPETGEPVKRKPASTWQNVETGLPWLRPRVPAGR